LDNLPPAAPTAIDLLASSDSGTSSSDDITNVEKPTLRVNLDTTASDGSAATVGNTLKLFKGASEVASVTLTQADITLGYKDVVLATKLDSGSNSVTAKLIDLASNTSTASTALAVSIDTAPPTNTVQCKP
jgi:hypothetical protein